MSHLSHDSPSGNPLGFFLNCDGWIFPCASAGNWEQFLVPKKWNGKYWTAVETILLHMLFPIKINLLSRCVENFDPKEWLKRRGSLNREFTVLSTAGSIGVEPQPHWRRRTLSFGFLKVDLTEFEVGWSCLNNPELFDVRTNKSSELIAPERSLDLRSYIGYHIGSFQFLASASWIRRSSLGWSVSTAPTTCTALITWQCAGLWGCQAVWGPAWERACLCWRSCIETVSAAVFVWCFNHGYVLCVFLNSSKIML